MTNEPSPRPWRTKRSPIGSNTWIVSGETFVASASRIADAALIVAAVNERDKLKAECDRLRTAYADLWRAVKRIEADSRLGLGTGLEVASSALHYVHTYASSAIRAAEKKGLAPAIGEDKP